jgi:hypothetical protein
VSPWGAGCAQNFRRASKDWAHLQRQVSDLSFPHLSLERVGEGTPSAPVDFGWAALLSREPLQSLVYSPRHGSDGAA